MVQRDIVMNILKEIDPKGTNMQKACRLHRRMYVPEGLITNLLQLQT